MITSDVSSTTLNGNGVTTAFPFTFEVFSTAELEAWVLNADGTYAKTTDWTAVLTTGGGTLTYPAVGATKLPTGAKITILRAMEFTQEVDLVNGNSFRAEVIEGALDNLTMQTLQLKEAVARAVRVPAGSSTLPDDLLAELADDVVAAAAAKDDAVTAQGLAEDARDDAQTAQGLAEDARDAAIVAASLALESVYSVTAYGAVGNGTTDDTTSIQAAIDAASVLGGTVLFPSGTYLVSNTLTIDANNVAIRGTAPWNTIITRSGDFGDTIFVTGDDADGTLLTGFSLKNIAFSSTGLTTSGAHVHLNGCWKFSIESVYMYNGFVGFDMQGATAGYIRDVYVVFSSMYGGSATGRAYMHFHGAAATYAHPSCGDVFISDFNMRGTATSVVTEYGIRINCSDGLWFTGGHLGGCTGANIRLNGDSADDAIGLVFFNGVMCDKNSGFGVLFSGSSSVGRNIVFGDCQFKGGATGTRGIYFASGSDFNNVQFSNCFISEYTLQGVYINSAEVENVTFTGCQVRGNSYAAAGVHAGYHISAGTKIQIVGGCSGGHNVDPDTSTQSYGVLTTTDASYVVVDGVDLRGNVAAPIVMNGTAAANSIVKGVLTDAVTAIASATTITIPLGVDYVTITGTTAIANCVARRPGQIVVLKFDDAVTISGAGTIKTAGSRTTSAGDRLTLVCDGTNWYEMGFTDV